MAGKKLASKQMMDLNCSFLYFCALIDSISVFLLFLARQKTQILPLVFFSFIIFFNCGNAVFSQTEKKPLSHLLYCSGQRIIPYDVYPKTSMNEVNLKLW